MPRSNRHAIQVVARVVTSVWFALALMSCGGGGGGTPVPTANGGPGTGQGSTTVNLPAGGSIEVPDGALPAGVTLQVEETETPVLPAALTAVGATFHVGGGEELDGLATLRLPVPPLPPGVVAADLSLVRVQSSGAITILETSVDADELVAVTPGFSAVVAAAAVSRAKIIGPEFLPTGKRGLFQEVGFELDSPEALRLTWSVYGNAALESILGRDVVVLGGEEGGRADLAVDLVDPITGLRHFATRSVPVLTPDPEADDVIIQILGGPTDAYYFGTSAPVFEAVALNAPDTPLDWSWSLGAGGDTCEGCGDSIPIRPRIYPTQTGTHVLSVDVTGANVAAHAEVNVTLRARALQAFLHDPVGVPSPWPEAGADLVLPYYIEGGEPRCDVRLTLLPLLTNRVQDELACAQESPGGLYVDSYRGEFSVHFPEPGTYLGDFTVADAAGSMVTRLGLITVDAENRLEVAIYARGSRTSGRRGLGLEATSGEAVNLDLELGGGVLVVSGTRSAYRVHVDWGDDSQVAGQSVAADSTIQGETLAVSHTYSEPGEYTVTARVTDATGNFTERSEVIRVDEGQGNTQQIVSSFDAGAEFDDRWGIGPMTAAFSGSFQTQDVAEYHLSNGNPGGYISWQGDQGDWWFFATYSAKYRGDRSFAYGKNLSFELRSDATRASDDFFIPLVVLSGTDADGNPMHLFQRQSDHPEPGLDWTPYAIALDAGSGWWVSMSSSLSGSTEASAADIRQVLSTMTSLRIRGEYQSWRMTGSLDNVVLGGN